MNRRAFVGGLGAVLAAPLAADSQTPGKGARVGALVFGPPWSPGERAAFLKGPFGRTRNELGWVEGVNVVTEWRFGESAEQLHAAAAALVRARVDALVVPSAGLAKIAQLETKTVPIVVLAAGDLVGVGLVASLARPGGNVTGIQILQREVISKRLEFLKALVPNLSRVANLEETVTLSELPQLLALVNQNVAEAGRTLGVEPHTYIVRRPAEFTAAFRDMVKTGDQALLVLDTPFTDLHGREIADLAVKHRLAICGSRASVETGGLMSYGANVAEWLRLAAIVLDKILRGANPAEVPVEQPTKFELVINLKTAKALGLTIPPSLLQRADQVIE